MEYRERESRRQASEAQREKECTKKCAPGANFQKLPSYTFYGGNVVPVNWFLFTFFHCLYCMIVIFLKMKKIHLR